MAEYEAVLMHGKRGGEGRYRFAADPEQVTTPVRMLGAFMAHLERTAHVGHIEFEVNSAFRHKETGIVTGIGQFHFEGGNDEPFAVFIAPVD